MKKIYYNEKRKRAHTHTKRKRERVSFCFRYVVKNTFAKANFFIRDKLSRNTKTKINYFF